MHEAPLSSHLSVLHLASVDVDGAGTTAATGAAGEGVGARAGEGILRVRDGRFKMVG